MMLIMIVFLGCLITLVIFSLAWAILTQPIPQPTKTTDKWKATWDIDTQILPYYRPKQTQTLTLHIRAEPYSPGVLFLPYCAKEDTDKMPAIKREEIISRSYPAIARRMEVAP